MSEFIVYTHQIGNIYSMWAGTSSLLSQTTAVSDCSAVLNHLTYSPIQHLPCNFKNLSVPIKKGFSYKFGISVSKTLLHSQYYDSQVDSLVVQQNRKASQVAIPTTRRSPIVLEGCLILLVKMPMQPLYLFAQHLERLLEEIPESAHSLLKCLCNKRAIRQIKWKMTAGLPLEQMTVCRAYSEDENDKRESSLTLDELIPS